MPKASAGRLSEVLVAVSTPRLSCKRAGKTRTLMPVPKLEAKMEQDLLPALKGIERRRHIPLRRRLRDKLKQLYFAGYKLGVRLGVHIIPVHYSLRCRIS